MSRRRSAPQLPEMGPHELFEWSWHHFAPLGREENFVPILRVLAAHEGRLVDDARDDVNRDVHALGLPVGLGRREDEPYADIFRDRIDVWRFTGALREPGLAGNAIQLSAIGQAIIAKTVSFEDAMARQAFRLSFPRVRVRRETDLDGAVDKLKAALAFGPGVQVAKAWVSAVAMLRAKGSLPQVSGEECARFLSGCARIDEVPGRASAIHALRSGLPVEAYPAVSSDKERQGRELVNWMIENGALVLGDDAPVFLDNPAYGPAFMFSHGDAREIVEWADWWGSI